MILKKDTGGKKDNKKISIPSLSYLISVTPEPPKKKRKKRWFRHRESNPELWWSLVMRDHDVDHYTISDVLAVFSGALVSWLPNERGLPTSWEVSFIQIHHTLYQYSVYVNYKTRIWIALYKQLGNYLSKANNLRARCVAKVRDAVLLDFVDPVVGSIPHAITRVPAHS